MPNTCVIRGCKNRGTPGHNEVKPVAFHRFPLKNELTIEHWERFVNQNNSPTAPWKATTASRICSDHFDNTDYIIPPSNHGTCRIKKYARPSKPIDLVTPATNSINEKENTNDANSRPTSFPPSDSVVFPSELDPDLPPPAKIRRVDTMDERHEMQKKLKQKVKNLQQQLRRAKQKAKTMDDVITKLKQEKIINAKEAEAMHSSFENTQLHFLYNFRDNMKAAPSARRYTDEIKEFALTLHYYSPRAYKYVRSIIPLPNPSLVRKWSSSFKCEPGFIEDAFTSLSSQISNSPNNKDCCLVVDAMAIRKQMLWNPDEDQPQHNEVSESISSADTDIDSICTHLPMAMTTVLTYTTMLEQQLLSRPLSTVAAYKYHQPRSSE